MNIVKKWFDEASAIVNVHKDLNEDFLIYKGFKIIRRWVKHSKSDSDSYLYKIIDTRKSEFYSPIPLDDYALLVECGFIAGVDEITNKLNVKRVEEYENLIKKLEIKLKIASKQLRIKGIDKTIHRKRVRLAKENIEELSYLVRLTKSKVKQFNNKYNKNGSKQKDN